MLVGSNVVSASRPLCTYLTSGTSGNHKFICCFRSPSSVQYNTVQYPTDPYRDGIVYCLKISLASFSILAGIVSCKMTVECSSSYWKNIFPLCSSCSSLVFHAAGTLPSFILRHIETGRARLQSLNLEDAQRMQQWHWRLNT